MRTQGSKPISVAAVLLALALFCTAHATADVTAEPDVLRFDSRSDSATVQLRSNGEALPADALLGQRLLASGHDYAYMFTYDKSDGALKLTPTGELEVGSYDLVLDTSAGHATVKVYAPLAEMESVVEKAASHPGISMQEARQRLGLTTTLPRVQVDIGLPPVYYEGQALHLHMPHDANRVYEWGVNGVVLKQGPGESAFTYVFEEPGNYLISYVEKEEGNVVAAELEATTVVPLPPVAWKVEPGQTAVLMGPAGYAAYVWTVDGKEHSRNREFKHTFEQAGQYVIECISTGPADGPATCFLRHRYETTVPGM